MANNTLETGTYEIIRNRLNNQANDLNTRLAQLNEERKKVFGAVETQLIANDRINTDNYCIARDILAMGNTCLFGYNVHVGLRSGIKLEDVFAAYEFQGNSFKPSSLDLIKNEKFTKDFNNLYRYYKNAFFSKFIRLGAYLYMVFQVSDNEKDIKTFKWLVKGNQMVYVDNRSEHEVRYPEQYEFQWQRATRDYQRHGKHPHVSILDRVFVETVGGDLTIKIEDNTEDGLGIYREDVEYPDQTLDDAEFLFADLGNLIALKIKPYQQEFRYFVFNEKLKEVQRVNALEDSGVLLPDNHGLIFSNGYYLQTGEFKIFDNKISDKVFERRIISPNGEDFIYVFYNQKVGSYVLLPYNIIQQAVATPIVCHGYTIFPNGELCYFKAEDDPTQHHVIQIWQTPFTEGEKVQSEYTDNYLYKVGNKDIVKAMASAREIIILSQKEDTYSQLYNDLVKKCTDVIDAYYWINQEAAFQLDDPIRQIRQTANSAIDEFEKKIRIQKNTQEEISRVHLASKEIFKKVDRSTFDNINDFVSILSELRTLRGEIISLRELRYTNLELVEELEQEAADSYETLSQNCVEFLLQEEALVPYQQRITEKEKAIEAVQTNKEGEDLEQEVNQIGDDLEMLIEIVSNLKIDDATQTTRIIDNISDMYGGLNQTKAAVKRRRKELMGTEAVAEFNAQLKLLDQGIINYMDVSDTPQKCDEYLTKLMVQLEELEGKFVEFDEFIEQIGEKREEIYNAFEAKKKSLTEARNNRTSSLERAAGRILDGIQNRVKQFKEVNEINGFFASDLMIDKVRDIINQLIELEDSNKADAVRTRLKTLKEETIRQLRDKKDLFVDGANVIRFGKHAFSVNVQPMELTTVLQEGKMFFHLTGTDFYEEIKDESFLATQQVWEQALVSEDKRTYRAEYLAYRIFNESNKEELIDKPNLLQFVSQIAQERYTEGYVKGIHNEDATQILKQLLFLYERIGLLRFSPKTRTAARIIWSEVLDEKVRDSFSSQFKAAETIIKVFPETREFDGMVQELAFSINERMETHEKFIFEDLKWNEMLQIAEYLFLEFTSSQAFTISKEAEELFTEFNQYIKKKKSVTIFEQSIRELQGSAMERFHVIKRWIQAFIDTLRIDHYQDFANEATALILLDDFNKKSVIDTKTSVDITGMHGEHQVIQDGNYHLDYNAFMEKMATYTSDVVPMFEQFQDIKKATTSNYKEDLRLEEFKPRVLSSFVRNRLIDKVYLPIFGDNLAKQIGTAGDNTRTDRMGMLLLISPPGYGKTTLMEYIANRLGLIFMKINGPAIGHQVTSLDPDDAPNMAAKQELRKLNLALEMGDNVMLYLDDIQHCHPEFLQKFISLCDAQRKIEGVYKGRSKTYDLRGKKVCVVMAGNPYTESGDKFQIPDMLANRADIYNLGDIIGDTADVFSLSYIENALTSNPVVQRLANKSMKDVHTVIQLAQTGTKEGLDFEANHSPEELNEYVSVIEKMLRIRDVILKVNMEYIRSAAMADDYRTEPSFKLQGSYRNMNKLTEKIAPVMNDEELETLILSHYEGESQTLTTGAEANFLKLKELMEVMSDEDQKRWDDIKQTFNKNKVFNNLDEQNPMSQVIAQLSQFVDGLQGIKDALEKK